MACRTETYVLSIFFGLFCCFLVSCGEKEAVKIGYVAGLTGRHSELGIGVRNGVILAVDRINKAGGINGHRLEVVIRDDGGSPSQAAKALNELIEMEVPLIVGPLLSKMAQTTIDIIDGKNVLVISPTISTDLVANRDDNFLRLIPESSFQGESIASAITKTEYKKIAVIYDAQNSEYTKPIFDVFARRMKDSGREISYVNDLTGGQEKELAKVAEQIVGSQCEAVFFITSSIDAGEICQQIRKQEKTIQFYGAYWVKSGKIVEIGGRSVEGMILSTIFERSNKSTAYDEFAGQYEYEFKSKPNFTSVYAYETVMVMAEGMRLSNSFEPVEIKTAILTKAVFDGLEEQFRINRYGDVERSKSLVQIRNGEFVRLDS